MDASTVRCTRFRRVRASGLAVLLATSALSTAAYAQGGPPPPPPGATPPVGQGAAPPAEAPRPAAPPVQTGVVKRIVIQGNVRIEQDTILSYLPIQPGDTIGPQQIDLGVKTLFRTDLFADVNIELVNGDLIVKVAENPIINQVVFEGNDNLKDDKLRDEVTVRPRGIFTRGKVQGDVQRIVELYRRSGRISVTVTPKIVELPQKRVDLIFEINEGPKSGITRINFIGNRQFADNDLRGVIVTKESRFYRFLSTNDNYDPDRLDYDQEQLRKFYRNHGFYDFRIINTVAELAPDKNGFAVTYTIDEGPKYKFGKLKVESQLKKLNGAVLQQLLPIREGQLYEDKKIEDATDALTFAAGAAGFAFVDVVPRYIPNRQTHTVDLTFDVKEGPRVYVDRIDIVGNTRTLDPVIRRELLVTEGDAYNRVLVDRSKNQIRGLGFFKDVDIVQAPGSAPDRTALQVKVTEQPTGELSFSAGYSSTDRLVVDLGISERNFRGRGQDVRAEVSIGSLRQQVNLSFTEPRFLGRNMSAGVDLYSYRYDFTSYAGYNSSSTGAALRLGIPLGNYSTLQTRYNIHNDDVMVNDAYCGANPTVSPTLCAERGNSFTSLFGYTIRWDHRNDPQNPTRGFYTELSQDLAGFGGNVKYLRTEGQAGWYHGFTPSWIFSATVHSGYIGGWGGSTVRINDRFYEGGNSFRGFQTAGVGPRDTASSYNQALGGKMFAIGTLEQTFPDMLPEQYGIKMALFTDFGTVGLLDPTDKRTTTQAISGSIKDDLGFRASAGISVFWKSPMGPIRIDLADVLAKDSYDRTENFRFSTSTRF
ncbi:MAG: outer membrane protein assembly factor BamA [Caulobacteraceae bacterium]|nr:outer membrane protein assembly factor BamA [Caulobacteraceae bacterium]